MSAAPAPPAPSRVVLHAAALLVLSFLMSANGNVLPQLFYQRLHADQKVLLLAVCLFVGTAGALAGVLASRGASASRPWVLLLLAATLGAEGALFLVRGAWVYVALNAAAQLGANYLMNHLDQAAASRAGEARRRLHDASGNVLRLLGMLAAPAFFTACYDRPGAILVVLAAAAALALASAGSLLAAAPGGAERAAEAVAPSPLRLADRLLFAFVICAYIAFNLFAANMIYLLRDVVGLAHAERRGGAAIVVAFVAALVANAGAAIARRRGADRGPRALALVAPIPPLVLSAAAMASGASLSPGVVLGGSVAVGLGYGVFLAEAREYASRGARAEGKTGLYTLFNNVANISSLIAFAAMTALAAGGRGSPAGAYRGVLAVIGGLPVAGLPLLFAAGAQRRRGKGAR